MNTFKQFAEGTIKASPILTEAEIEAFIASGDTDPLYRYAYRIAGFVCIYCRTRAPIGVDDTDWQDAVQECMTRFPSILKTYKKSEAPFLRYMTRAFQSIIIKYLWSVVKGGTGSGETEAQASGYLDRSYGDWGLLDNDGFLIARQSTAFGTRDPIIELMAEEAVIAALRYAEEHPKRGPKREW
jgi:hypothetical protein